ncbi:MAG: D-ribose pyranase [Mobilicoccus sp.]|nr:D-ribose pyranase [Mobilicoccus sp.]
MKRRGILHANLSRELAALGHTDRVLVGDMGLPIPRGIPVIDLAVVPGQVPFTTVLDALLGEIVVQGHVVAAESADSPAGAWFDERADLLGAREELSHEEFKARTPGVQVAIRTGEATPYANVILECGVPF